MGYSLAFRVAHPGVCHAIFFGGCHGLCVHASRHVCVCTSHRGGGEGQSMRV